MKKAPYVCLYLSYLNTLEPLSDTIRGKLMIAMLRYAQTGESPNLTGHAKLLWPGFQDQIDRDLKHYRERCKKNKVNGAKGGRPQKTENNQMVFKKPKEKENEKKNENKKENEREREKENEIENKTAAAEVLDPPAPPAFSPPGLEEVEQYISTKGLCMNAAEFIDHYTSNGWMVGKNPMRDWKAAVRRWNRKEHINGKTDIPFEDYQYGTVI